MVIEELLTSDLRIRIRERNTVTGTEAGSLADTYIQGLKRDFGVIQKILKKALFEEKGEWWIHGNNYVEM